MSDTTPSYSNNPIEDGLEHLGHWIHKGFTFVFGVIPKAISVTDDVVTQFPTAKAEAQTVFADFEAFAPLSAAIATAFAEKGLNFTQDETVAELFAKSGPAWTKFADDISTLAKTLGADVKTDAAAL